MNDTYEFDANISVMAESDSKAKAADKILEHCLNADIAISLHQNGTLNNIKKTADALEQAQEQLDEQDDYGNRLQEAHFRIEQLEESLDEAKYDEPGLRSKLDKQRQRIEQQTIEIERLEAAIRNAINRCGYAGNPEYVLDILEKALETAGDHGNG